MHATKETRAQGNQPPEIQSVRFRPDNPVPGQPIRASVQVSDPNNDRIELGFVWLVDGARRAVSGPELSLPEAVKGTEIEVRVVASDGVSESEPVVARIRMGNRGPVLKGLRIDPTPVVSVGDPVVVTAYAEDPDGDSLNFQYEWSVNGRARSEALGSSFSTEGLKQGDKIQVRVVASDGSARSNSMESVVVEIGNRAPEILSQPGSPGGNVFRYAVEARDPDGDRSLRFSLRTAPEGMRVDPVLGEITWRPTAEQAGKHPVELVVEDSGGARTVQAFEVTVDETLLAPSGAPAAPAPAPRPAPASLDDEGSGDDEAEAPDADALDEPDEPDDDPDLSEDEESE